MEVIHNPAIKLSTGPVDPLPGYPIVKNNFAELQMRIGV
jgi:hypothetical protein